MYNLTLEKKEEKQKNIKLIYKKINLKIIMEMTDL